MSVKDNWKEAGKGIGHSFAGLGKSIVKSVKVGVDKAASDEPTGETGLKQSWSEVGHSFGHAGKALGKAAASTVKKVTDEVDEAAQDEPQAPAAEAPAEDTPAE